MSLLVLKSEIFAGVSLHKVRLFTINRKELHHIFMWKFERSSRNFSHFSEQLLLKIALQTKTCSKLTTLNKLELLQLMLFESLLMILQYIFTSATESIFNLNGSVRFCFQFQAVIKSVFVMFQAFAINSSYRVSNGGCFDCHVIVVCFL